MQAIGIGTQYIDRKKRLCTVTDVWTTYNAAGEPVRIRYVVAHDFCGQSILEHDVLPITIKRLMQESKQ